MRKNVQVKIEVFSNHELTKIMLLLFKNEIDCVVTDKQDQKVGEIDTMTGNWFIDNNIKYYSSDLIDQDLQ